MKYLTLIVTLYIIFFCIVFFILLGFAPEWPMTLNIIVSFIIAGVPAEFFTLIILTYYYINKEKKLDKIPLIKLFGYNSLIQNIWPPFINTAIKLSSDIQKKMKEEENNLKNISKPN